MLTSRTRCRPGEKQRSRSHLSGKRPSCPFAHTARTHVVGRSVSPRLVSRPSRELSASMAVHSSA
eukprot:6634179-Prymnesium_polylepis.2